MEERVMLNIKLSYETYQKLQSLCGNSESNFIGKLISDKFEETICCAEESVEDEFIGENIVAGFLDGLESDMKFSWREFGYEFWEE